MRKYKHTTGPWKCIGGAVYKEGDESAPIAYMCRDERATKAGIYPVERDSNAVLIAAAPELLAACKNLTNSLSNGNTKIAVFDEGSWVEGNLDAMLAAIDKAERG